MEDYLEEADEPERPIRDIRRATLDISMTLVPRGPAFKNKGAAAARRGDRLPAQPARRAFLRSRASRAARSRTARARPRRARRPMISLRGARKLKVALIPTSASSRTSGSTPASSAGGRVLNSITGRMERVGRILDDARRTAARSSRRSMPGTSPRASASSRLRPATPCTPSTPGWCSSPCSSRSRSYTSPSSPRRRPTRRS